LFQAKLLELALLSDDEVNWLNDYHTETWDKVRASVGSKAVPL
jgi:hypothetical protein